MTLSENEPNRDNSILYLISILIVAIWVVSQMKCSRVNAAQNESTQIQIDTVFIPDVEFSDSAFKKYIVDSGLKFPHIVYAQAVLESGEFTSRIWTENNNPFGMKVAKSRNTTAIGANRGHAVYKNWRMAVLDYAYLQAVFARKCKTDDDYFKFLESYASDPSYKQKLISIIDGNGADNF